MADKKSGASSSAHSKNSHSKKSSGAKPKNKPKSKNAASRAKAKKQAELQYYLKRNRFKKGLFLIAFGVLFALLFCIPGEKLWLALHQCYWGLFGFLGCLVPALNGYGAFQMLREKPTYRLSFKIAIYIVTILLLAATVYSFGSDGMNLADYGSELMNCFRQGSQYNGTGFIGGILGIPLAKLFGATGGGLVALVFFLAFLFMSLEALFINIIDQLKEPVSEKLHETKELRNRIREEEKKIKKQQQQIAQEEYIQRQAQKRVESSKRKEEENSAFRRIDKTPIYQPETSAPVGQKPSNPDVPSNDVGFTPTPKPPKKPKKKKPESPPKTVNMDYVSQDTPAFADNIDVQSLIIPEEESSPKDYNDNYYEPEEETDSSVFNLPKKAKSKQNKKSDSESDKSEPPQPKPKKEHKPKKQDEPKPDNIDFQNTDISVSDGRYLKPPFTLLQPQPKDPEKNISQELNQSAAILVDTLKSFGVQTTITHISRGPSVTRYELQPASGIKISKITNLSDDIAMNLAATGVRIEAPIPGKSAVGIEVPNKNVSTVKMRSLVESAEFQNAKSKLTVALGMDITGKITLADLSKMPHLLIAGSTGSGKSVCINSMLVSLLYKASPDEVKLMLIDPKVVELGVYNGIPHLLVPVVTDPRKAAGALNWAVNEMLKRYNIFAEHNVRDMHSYNRLVDRQNSQVDEAESVIDDSQRSFDEDEMLAQAQEDTANAAPKPIQKLEKMPQIVIVIDELADLMMAAPNEVEESICRLAQMARAAGMHLVIATQRPSVDVITGLIKANVPSRIAFAVKSQIDSRTILDSGGAEKLLGRGDMLFSPIGTNKPIRVQGCYVDDTEIEKIIDFIKKNKAVEYDSNVIEEIEKNAVSESSSKGTDTSDGDTDPMMEQAIKCVVEAGQASTSLLQRRLRLGYARAGRLIDEMEQMGIVGPHEGSKPRQVLMTYQQYLERNVLNDDES